METISSFSSDKIEISSFYLNFYVFSLLWKRKDRLFLSPQPFTSGNPREGSCRGNLCWDRENPTLLQRRSGCLLCFGFCVINSACISFPFKQCSAGRAGSTMRSAGQRGCALGQGLMLVVHAQQAEGICTLLKRCPLLLSTHRCWQWVHKSIHMLLLLAQQIL